LTYTVKEIFYTLQGEGAQTGRAAVFCRFSGCNLWSGREEDRSRAVCQFCDTDFVGTGPDGGRFRSAKELADAIDRCWAGEGHNADEDDPSRRSAGLPKKYVVCTGGEPLLQVDETLISELHQRGFEVAVETNGTRPAPQSLDWICVSPKAGAPLVQTTGASSSSCTHNRMRCRKSSSSSISGIFFFSRWMDPTRSGTPSARSSIVCAIRAGA
jgi:Organic radical activating enzymes